MSGRRGLVETNIFVSARNPAEAEHSSSRRALDLIDAGDLTGVVSMISIAEIRAGLSPTEARAIWQAFTSHLVSSKNYELAPVDLSVAELAGELREGTKLSLPDALVVATGKLRAVDFILSWDRDLAKRQAVVPVRSPKELA